MEALASNYVPLSYVYAARYGEGRATVPVLKSQALYANFSHVSGVAAQDGTAAYSIDKLHILDVLIGQLESVKSQPLAAAEAPSDLSSSPRRRPHPAVRRRGARHRHRPRPALCALRVDVPGRAGHALLDGGLSCVSALIPWPSRPLPRPAPRPSRHAPAVVQLAVHHRRLENVAAVLPRLLDAEGLDQEIVGQVSGFGGPGLESSPARVIGHHRAQGPAVGPVEEGREVGEADRQVVLGRLEVVAR